MCEHVRRTVPDSYYYGDPERRRRILSQCENLNRGPPSPLLSPDFSLVKWPATRVRRRLKRTITPSGSTAGKGQRPSVPSTWKDCLVAGKLMSSESKSAVEEGECSTGNKMSEEEVTTAQCAQRTSLAQLYVNGLSSETFSLEVLPEEEASAVYQAVEQRTGIPMSDQLLMFHGHKVFPLLSLNDQGITAGSTLHLSLLLRGGAGDPPTDGLTDKMLGRLARKIGENWRAVGLELNISDQQLKRIRAEETRVDYCANEMLQTWLRNTTEHSNRVDELLTALREADLRDIAEEFERQLLAAKIGQAKTESSASGTSTEHVGRQQQQKPQVSVRHTVDEGGTEVKSTEASPASKNTSTKASLESLPHVNDLAEKPAFDGPGALVSSSGDNDLSDLEDTLKMVNRKDYDKVLLVNGMSHSSPNGDLAQMTFLSKINWNTIFDFDPDCECDGFIHTVTNSVSTLHFEKMSASTYLHKNSISQPAQCGLGSNIRPWVFVNEKNAGETKTFRDWMMQDSEHLVDALQNYNKCCVALATVVVLSSEQALEHMALVMERLVTLGFTANTDSGVRLLTVITISKELREKFLACAYRVRSELSPHCFVASVDDMSRIFTPGTAAPSTRPEFLYLPQSNGHGLVDVPRDVVDKWVGLHVLSSCQCENEDFTESQKNDAAIDFYKGQEVTWWNFHFEHDVTRTQLKEFLKKLRSQAEEVEKLAISETKAFHVPAIRIVKLIYQCGTGGTTMAWRLLWELRCDYRCAVVQCKSRNVCKSIAFFQRHNEPAVMKPVIILVDRERWLWLRGFVDELRRLKVRCVILFVEAQQDEESASLQELEELDVDEDLVQNEVLKLKHKLDRKEQGFVKIKIKSLEGHEKCSEAVRAVENAGLFIYVGLELFGQQYNQERLAEFVKDRLSPERRDVTDRHRHMLEFCSLLYLYIHESFPKERFNMHVLGLDSFRKKMEVELCPPVTDLLVEYEDKSTSLVCYRPAHICVAELILSNRPLKNICLDFVRYLPDDNRYTVQHLWSLIPSLFIIRTSSMSNNFESYEPDLVEGETLPPMASATLKQGHRQSQEFKRLRFSNLINKILNQHDGDGSGINKALDILMRLCEKAKDRNDQCYAFTWQVISRLLAYCLENSLVSPATAQAVISLADDDSAKSPISGFDAAIMCINKALKIKPEDSTLLTTKGNILKLRLANEFGKAKSEYGCSAEDLLHATQLGRAACSLFEEARNAREMNWYATVGDIATCLWLLRILKSAEDLNEKYDRDSVNYLNFLQGTFLPRKLEYHLSQEAGSLDFLRSMEKRIRNLLDGFYAKEHLKTKMYGEEGHVDKWHDSLQLFQNLEMDFLQLLGGLPKLFKRNRASLQQCERAVHYLLSQEKEWPYSSWYTLSEDTLQEIIQYLKPLIEKQEVSNHRSITCLVRACFECNTIPKGIDLPQSLFAVICKWAEMSSSIDGEGGEWAHLFNYIIHFPHDQAPEWANTKVTKDSLRYCKQSFDKQTKPWYFLTNKPMASGFPLIPARCVGDGKKDPEFHSESFWRSTAVSNQLKRVCGIKAGIGVIQYLDFRLNFNNDFYPKPSPDRLYFYVGFSFYGPRPYDPISESQYEQLSKSQSLQSESKMSATQSSAEPIASSSTSKAKSKVSVGRSSGNSGQTKQKFRKMEVTSPVTDRRMKTYQQQSMASKANKASQISKQPLDHQLVGGDSSCDDNWQTVKRRKEKSSQPGGLRPRASSGHPALESRPLFHQELPGSPCSITQSNSFSQQRDFENELASASENPSDTLVDMLQRSLAVDIDNETQPRALEPSLRGDHVTSVGASLTDSSDDSHTRATATQSQGAMNAPLQAPKATLTKSAAPTSTAKASRGKTLKQSMPLFRDISRSFLEMEDVYALADTLLEAIESQGGTAWVKAKTAPGGVPKPQENAYAVLSHWFRHSPHRPYGRELYDVLCKISPRVAEDFEKKLLPEG